MRLASETDYEVPASATDAEWLRAAVSKNLGLMLFTIQGDDKNAAVKVKVFVEMEA